MQTEIVTLDEVDIRGIIDITKMGTPIIKWVVNTGTEEVPIWTEIDNDKALYLTGTKTNENFAAKVTAPQSLSKFPEQLWIGNQEVYENGYKVELYEKDITTAINTNILAIQFDDNPLSTAPIINAWDNTNYNTTIKKIFSGSELFPGCMLRAHITSSNIDPSAGPGTIDNEWKTQKIGDDIYCLKGDKKYIRADSAIDAGKQIRFIITSFIPIDFEPGLQDPVIAVEYNYT